MRACTFCGSWTAPPESSERMRMPDFFLGADAISSPSLRHAPLLLGPKAQGPLFATSPDLDGLRLLTRGSQRCPGESSPSCCGLSP